jgi:hypothetical protein
MLRVPVLRISMCLCGLIPGIFATKSVAGAEIKIVVTRHPLAPMLTDGEARRILAQAQELIFSGCRSVGLKGACPLLFKTEGPVYAFNLGKEDAKFAPSGNFTWRGIAELAKRATEIAQISADRLDKSYQPLVIVRVVPAILACPRPPDPGTQYLGCTVRSASTRGGRTVSGTIFVELTPESVSIANGQASGHIRDDDWFARQAVIWAHEIGHVAGLRDLCGADRGKSLMFRWHSLDTTKVSMRECRRLSAYPRVPAEHEPGECPPKDDSQFLKGTGLIPEAEVSPAFCTSVAGGFTCRGPAKPGLGRELGHGEWFAIFCPRDCVC